MANISEKIRKMRRLGRLERKTEGNVVMSTWKWVDNER